MQAKDCFFPQASSPGISKREWFASFAMNTLLHSAAWENPVALNAVAEAAFEVADAMIAAGERDLTGGKNPA